MYGKLVLHKLALRPLAAPAAVALVTAFVHLGSLSGGFHYDDGHSIVRNPHITSLADPLTFLVNPTSFSERPADAMYRPLVVGSLALNFAAGGLEPRGYLRVNLLIHSLAAAAACLLLRALGLSAATALAGGLIFGLHPVQTEPINYISARSESLAALFYLTALTLYLRTSGPLRDPRNLLGYVGSLAAFLLALLSKEVAITLPLMVLVLHVARSDREHGGLVRRLFPARDGPLWAICLVYGLAYGLLLTGPSGELGAAREPLAQIATQLKALVHYLKLSVLPVTMSVQPQFSESPSPLALPCLGALLPPAGAPLTLRGSAGRSLLAHFEGGRPRMTGSLRCGG